MMTMNGALPALIQSMLQADFYPHSVALPIQLYQTHISYVLLAGQFVYKVKKPIQFGFLDFSTLDLRRYYCQEELRLNQRWAPDLYLKVLPIVFSPNTQQWRLGQGEMPEGEIWEYTVQMRQFQQDGYALLQRGLLTPERLQALGHRVARCHQVAPTNDEIRHRGEIEAIRSVDANNFRLSEPYLGRIQTAIQYEETKAYIRHFQQVHVDWYQQRLVTDHIRECHGDLHLGNLCLFNGQVQLFDCIEFNTEFRYIDTINDIAFLVMDLVFQGCPASATYFLNTYLEWTGDYQGALLLYPYLAMRAYIRGNVCALASEDVALDGDEQQQQLERARAYYHLAWQYTQARSGQLFLMSGLSGSGKSTVARALAAQTQAIHIRSDAVRKHLAGLPLEQRGDQPGAYGDSIYTLEMTRRTYQYLLTLGKALARQGWTVILDATYDHRAERQAAIATAQTDDIPLSILYCTAPIDVLRQRICDRSHDVSDATPAILAQQQQRAEPFTEQEQTYVTIIHTDRELAPQLRSFQPSSLKIPKDMQPLAKEL